MIRVTLQRLIFQSTHPLRGATSNFDRCRSLWIYFNPRTPCGVRPFGLSVVNTTNLFQSTHPLRGATSFKDLSSLKTEISIHAPLAGCDLGQVERIDARHPAISIHAPLAGCDVSFLNCYLRITYFNPRTPCGVRQRKCTKFSAHFAITDNSIGFPRPECRLLGHFLLIPGACSARERVRTFL